MKVAFTATRVARFRCPPSKPQAFLWSSTQPGLGLRATPSGKPAYVFQSRFQDKTLRLTIGRPDAWSIPQAHEKAREFQRHIDEGRDPRAVKKSALAAEDAKRDADSRAELTVAEAWSAYLAERKPHWGALHYRDHVDKAKPGSALSRRRGYVGKPTRPGPLASLMPLRLADLDSIRIESWALAEGKVRASSARLSWRLLTVFLTWCSEHAEYASLLPTKNPAKTKKTREALGKATTKTDVLQREQLATWFKHVRAIRNPVTAAYLQVLLLTGARPGEVLSLRWDDLDTQWKGISIRDKVEGTRAIPATPYVLSLLAALPRCNQWIFASVSAAKSRTGPKPKLVVLSTSGRIAQPNNAHTRACTAAGLDGLTLHGLRRSFASLTEWLEVPAGVVAQIQGHKPSATAEKHYKVRPLELLRVHHERIEAWLLEQAGVEFTIPHVREARAI